MRLGPHGPTPSRRLPDRKLELPFVEVGRGAGQHEGDRFSDDVGQPWRYSIAELMLPRPSRFRDDHIFVWKCLEAHDLELAQPPIPPVEGPDVWTRLALDCRGWALGIEL